MMREIDRWQGGRKEREREREGRETVLDRRKEMSECREWDRSGQNIRECYKAWTVSGHEIKY